MNMSVRKRLASFVILGLLGSCWKGLATDTPFLDIVGYDRYDGEKQVHVFIKRGGEKVEFGEDEVVAAADPAYDQTFKSLFTGNAKIDSYSGQDRLMSLLNSLLYPDAEVDGFKIRRIEELSSERPRAGVQVDSTGLLRSDVACRCYCYDASVEGDDENAEIIDVEMQTSRDSNFLARLFEYGFAYKRDYANEKNWKTPVQAIGFLLHKKNKDEEDLSKIGTLVSFTLDGRQILNREECPVYATIIDLVSKLDIMHKSPHVAIQIETSDRAGIRKVASIGKIGQQWFSLLGTRLYLGQTGIRGRYYFPLCSDLDPLVKSALSVLQAYDQNDLSRVMDQRERRNSEIQSELEVLRKHDVATIKSLVDKNRTQAEVMEKQAEENRKQAEENRKQAEENRKQAAEIARLKELLAKETKKRDDQSMENLKKHGGSPKDVALLKGETS